jgi:hypothetical protein
MAFYHKDKATIVVSWPRLLKSRVRLLHLLFVLLVSLVPGGPRLVGSGWYVG